MSWYRKYRPQTVASLHIAPVRQEFERILKSGSFSHAYLLTGPKGTGKTSGARILAKIVNCELNAARVSALISSAKSTPGVLVEPCNVCATCLSITSGQSMCVTEMDAASNRGIDDIRSLTSTVGLSTGEGLIHVYIIDEVHMLTTEAFNALLKVLEEPPNHVMFILATTELHKVPATIISRCTQVSYRKATKEEITISLQSIAKKEDVVVDEELLSKIADLADGSFRDAVKTFEQIAGGKKSVKLSDVEGFFGGSLSSQIENLIQILAKRSYEDALAFFRTCDQHSVDLCFLQKEILKSLHTRLLAGTQINSPHIDTYVSLLKALNIPPITILPIPGLPFEIACLEWCLSSAQNKSEPKESAVPKSAPKTVQVDSVVPTQVVVEQPAGVSYLIPEIVVVPSDESADSIDPLATLQTVIDQWHHILKQIKTKNSSVEALLRAARPLQIVGKTLQIEVMYQFHKEQLELDRNRKIIESVLESICSHKMLVVFLLNKKAVDVASQKDSNLSGKVDDASLIQAAQDAFL